MKKPPLLEEQQQRQQQHPGRCTTGSCRRRWLNYIFIPVLCSLVAVCCLVTVRFTRTTTTSSAGTTAAFLRRPSGLYRQEEEAAADDEAEAEQRGNKNNVGSYDALLLSPESTSAWLSFEEEPSSSSSSFSIPLRNPNRHHRILQNEDDVNNLNHVSASSSRSSSCSETCCAPFIEKTAAKLRRSLPIRTLQEAPSTTGEATGSGLPTWLEWVLMILCISISSLFSGLTLGMMGLDLSGLEIVMYVKEQINNNNAQIISKL
jgi:hypothetical protein